MEEVKRKDKVSFERGKITQTFGEVTFNSNFDSGNLDRVETVLNVPDTHRLAEFNLWTAPDCAGTQYENGNRSWFYYSVATTCNYSGKAIKMTIKNLNKQSRLYQQGLTPLIRSLSGKGGWERMRDRPEWQVVDNRMELSFSYTPPEGRKTVTYFAFCYPFSYTDLQKHLIKIEQRISRILNTSPSSSPPPPPPPSEDSIYYHRDLLCHTLDGLRVDLLTVSSHRGIATETEPRLPRLFPDWSTPTARQFRNKKVVFITSRVHPGETPASFVFNGFLDFLLQQDDPRARALLSNFVFKLVPMINPDGVSRGHYRTDSRGVNLNRVYLDPDPNLHPSVYAIHQLVLYYNDGGGCGFTDSEGASEGEKILPSLSSLSQISSTIPSSTSQCVTDESRPPDDTEQDKPCPPTKDSSSLHSDSDSNTRTSKPQDRNLALYVDLHAHATKRGCFMYGNHFKDASSQSDCMLLPKLVSLNSAHFDFEHCLFSERNMYAADRKNEGGGTTKEGSGRVALYKATGLIQCYTLECNYNSGRIVNQLTQTTTDSGRATPPADGSLIPHKLIAKDFEEVGRGLAIGLLDLYQCNPWSRLGTTVYSTLSGLRNHLFQKIMTDRKKGGGGETSNHIMKRCSNNKLDRDRSCVKPLHSEPMAPPSPPPPPDDVPLLKLVTEEGSGCALTPCAGTPTNNVKLIMTSRHFSLPSSAKLGSKDGSLLSSSSPSHRLPPSFQKPNNPFHLPLVPLTHRGNPYFHPHEGLLMIGTSPLRMGGEPSQKLTTRITSFPQQGGKFDYPLTNGKLYSSRGNLKAGPLRASDFFTIMGRNLGQRLYTRSLVIDRCSIEKQTLAGEGEDSTCVSTCTCNTSTGTCSGTCTCTCDDRSDMGGHGEVNMDNSVANNDTKCTSSFSSGPGGRKKLFSKASPFRNKMASRRTTTHPPPPPPSHSTKVSVLKYTPTAALTRNKRQLL